MANNRMYLKNRRTGAKVLLAKYYPSTGWYAFHAPDRGVDLISKLDETFDTNEPETTMWGDNDWLIEYEHEVEPHNG
jgi:hypothetical protein